jgi:hypothetical protein
MPSWQTGSAGKSTARRMAFPLMGTDSIDPGTTLG